MKKLSTWFPARPPRRRLLFENNDTDQSNITGSDINIFSYNRAVTLIDQNDPSAYILTIFSLQYRAENEPFPAPALALSLTRNTHISVLRFFGLQLSVDLLSQMVQGLLANSMITNLSFSMCTFTDEAEESGNGRALLGELLTNLLNLVSFQLIQKPYNGISPDLLQGIFFGLGFASKLKNITLTKVDMSDVLTTKSLCKNFALLDNVRTYDLTEIQFNESDNSRAIFAALAPDVLSRPSTNNICDLTLFNSNFGDKGSVLLCQAFAKNERYSRELDLHLINCGLTDISTLALWKLISSWKIKFNKLTLKNNRLITGTGYKLMLQGYCLIGGLDSLSLRGFHYTGGAELIIMVLEQTHVTSVSIARSGFSLNETELTTPPTKANNGLQRLLDWQRDHPSTSLHLADA